MIRKLLTAGLLFFAAQFVHADIVSGPAGSFIRNQTSPQPNSALNVGTATVRNLTAGRCVQAGTGGLLTVTDGPCGSSTSSLTGQIVASPMNSVAFYSGAGSTTTVTGDSLLQLQAGVLQFMSTDLNTLAALYNPTVGQAHLRIDGYTGILTAPVGGTDLTLTTLLALDRIDVANEISVTPGVGTQGIISFGANGAGNIAFLAPMDITTGGYNLTWPSSSTFGALVNDGAGNLDWSVSGAASTIYPATATIQAPFGIIVSTIAFEDGSDIAFTNRSQTWTEPQTAQSSWTFVAAETGISEITLNQSFFGSNQTFFNADFLSGISVANLGQGSTAMFNITSMSTSAIVSPYTVVLGSPVAIPGVKLAIHPDNYVHGVNPEQFGNMALVGRDAIGNIAYSGFTATGSITESVLWSLPPADGTAGYALATDGNQHLYFAPISGGGGGGSSIEMFFGIAKSTPTTTLKGATSDFSGSVTGSTMTISLSSNVARSDRNNTWTLPQTYASSVTASGAMLVGGLLTGTTVAAYQVNATSVAVSVIRYADGSVSTSSISGVAGAGDVTSVTAGYGLVGGGTSGALTVGLSSMTTSYIRNDNNFQPNTTAYIHSVTAQERIHLADGTFTANKITGANAIIQLTPEQNGVSDIGGVSVIDSGASGAITSIGYSANITKGQPGSNWAFYASGGDTRLLQTQVDNGKELRFYPPFASNYPYVAFKATSTVVSSQTYVLPITTGAVDSVLAIQSVDDEAHLYWKTDETGGGGGSGDAILAANQTFSGVNTFVSTQGVKMVPTGGTGATIGTSGAMLLDCSSATHGLCSQIYRNDLVTPNQASALLFLMNDATNYANNMLWIKSDSTSTLGGNADINIHSNNPDIEFRELDTYNGVDGVGQWEIAVNFDNLQINGRNTDNTSFQTLVAFDREDGMKFKEMDGFEDFISLRASTTLSGSYSLVLPSDAPSVNERLAVTGQSGANFEMGWVSAGGGSGGTSVYPATATASFPFGISVSTIEVTGGGAGGFDLTEGSEPSPIAGKQVVWADSTDRWLKFIPNGTTDYQVVGSSSSPTAGNLAVWSSSRTLVDGGAPGGGSGASFAHTFRPEAVKLPGLSPATVSNSTNALTSSLLYDASAIEYSTWTTTLNQYQGGALKIDVYYSMASATSGTVEFHGQIACISPGDSVDVDAKAFAAVGTATETVPGTAGHPSVLTITPTDDSCADGDLVVLGLFRNATDGTDDTATGDAEVRAVRLYE